MTEAGGGFVLATVVSVILWVCIYKAAMWVYSLPLEVMLKGTAAGLLLLGSWLVVRACMELDR